MSAGRPMTDKLPDPAAIRDQLNRILDSEEFRASVKQRRFLHFVIDEALADRGAALKGYTIAVNVYGRGDGFDPQIDPIVRVEAGRLRRALERYYLTAGSSDPIRIDVPKGGYVPRFRLLRPVPAAPATGTAAADPIAVTSIAVMPLVDMTGDDEREYFTDGLTEELTSELTRYQDFRVIASQSSQHFKDRQADPRMIGEELGVRFILTGNVRRDPQAIKVSIQLHDTATNQRIWGESYKRRLTAADLITVQEEIAGRVVGIIADQWGLISRRLSRESARKAPADLTVYDAVLRFYHYETVLTAESFESALQALGRAVESEPDYGLAWSMLGHLHADNHALGFRGIGDCLGKALEYTKKGVALEPDSQFAWDALALAHFHLGNRDLLIETIDRTIALNPNSPYIVGVAGWHLSLCGEWERGRKLLAQGMELNPYHPTWFHLAPFMDHFRQREYEKAYADALKFNFPELFWDPLLRATALVRLERPEEATAAIGQLFGLVPDFATSGRRLIEGYVKVGDLVEDLVAGLREAGLAELE